jgi:nickel-dependent lactate racemase
MPNIQLRYGKTRLSFDYDETRFQVLGSEKQSAPLSDAEIGERLDNPVDSPPLEEIVNAGETVLIVVPDATRQTASGQIVNLLVRRLIANGTPAHDIRIIFATGIHRRVTEEEKREILTPFIAQRIKTLDHNARDLVVLLRLGETASGIPIELNRALVRHDRVIIVGGVTFHYFAGFTGGRKLICPGLASSRTINETHRLAFDCETKLRRAGVGLGLLQGNPVHEAFAEVVEKINPAFSINTFVDEQGAAIDLFCGDWRAAHEKACAVYAANNTIEIAGKREVVVVSGGGFPYDINLIQAHKALETASQACTDGGTIILLAECADGLGRKDFLNWFDAENAEGLAEKLCAGYQVNGQTAWSLLKKAERFDVQIITSLTESETRPMRLAKARSLDEILQGIDKSKRGYIVPFGAKFLLKAETREIN